MARARIVEVFSSLQGEGLRLGERQIFVRFGGCNLRCDYCDEPLSLSSSAGALWSAARLKARILALQRTRRHRAISWTGGEPLLWAEFLLEMMAWAKRKGFENHLETNGVLPARLKLAAGLADVVAMDVKLPSATGRSTWRAHAACVHVAPEKTFVKVVLTAASRTAEVRRVLKILEDLPDVPLILQPATPDLTGKVRPIAPERAMAFFRLARSMRKGVRLTPQWHPIWGVR
ncbi:MAG: 7-carboxy-7-deazaguanine synthase QueE [Elusimicrobia bacterium]|nr:7-carboxy-7-deazaguanine synthase QueE [Elusimicrobiota bacterium]